MPPKKLPKKALPKVEVLPIEKAATPDLHNVNKHTARGGQLLSNSLTRRGAFRSIASAGKGVDTPVVGAGNLTLQEYAAAGFTEIINVHTDGHQLINHVRDDLEPGSPDFVALAIEDNEINKQSYNPDADVVAALAVGENAVLAAQRQQDPQLNALLEGMGGLGDDNYTRKVMAPEYQPSAEKPEISDLFDDAKTKALLASIDQAQGLTDQEKAFLGLAAQRHTILHFNKIADYYAHASPPMQALMEESALIIIDLDKAISQGFVDLISEIMQIMGGDYDQAE